MAPSLRRRVPSAAPSTIAPARGQQPEGKPSRVAKPARKGHIHRTRANLSKPLSAKRNPRPRIDATVLSDPESTDSAIQYRVPGNPQATLLGLPAELRLQIYSYLNYSTIIHIHRHTSIVAGTQNFTWTPCKGANPNTPLLCANPKWSGLCAEKDRCTYKTRAPPEPRGFFALAASCKFIHNEAQESLTQNAVCSIHPRDLISWLSYLEERAPKQLANLRRITLAGPSSTQPTYYLKKLCDTVTGLEAVGFQYQYQMQHPQDVQCFNFEKNWRASGTIRSLMRTFGNRVSLAFEKMVWKEEMDGTIFWGQPRWEKEELVVLRLVREGNAVGEGGENGNGWGDDNVRVEVFRPGEVVESKKNALWRNWWDDNHVWIQARGFPLCL